MKLRARQLVPDALFISAQTRVGLDALENRCVELIADAFGSIELLVPHDRYDVIARLHEFGEIQEQEDIDGAVGKAVFPDPGGFLRAVRRSSALAPVRNARPRCVGAITARRRSALASSRS